MSNAVVWNEKSLADAIQAAAFLALFAEFIEGVLTTGAPPPNAVKAMFREAEELVQRGIFAAT